MTLAKLKEFLFPVHRSELRQFFPMTLLFFLVGFIYNILRPLKLSLIIAAPESGAEVVPFLKVWGVLPGAFFMTFLFAWLSRHLNREQVFYAMMSLFLGFFLVFLTILYPFREHLELGDLAHHIAGLLPAGAKGLIIMLRYWYLTLFYLFAELWSNVIFSMLLWGFANETTSLDVAKRFYPVFALSANVGSVAAGECGMILSKTSFIPSMPFGTTAWEQSVTYFILLVLFSGGWMIRLFWSANRSCEMSTLEREGVPASKEKIKFSLSDCLRYVKDSRYLAYLAIMVVCYNIVFNLTDVMWTDQVQLRFQSDAGEMNSFMSEMTMIKGLIATFSALFVTGNLVRICGWLVAALVTPVIILLTSAMFFPFILWDNMMMTNLAVGVLCFTGLQQAGLFFGSMQNSLTRAAKYTVFDATKEMVYIPLSPEEQRKGKATIDGIGSRFGKSGGSILYQALLMVCSSLTATGPYVAGLVVVFVALWIVAIFGLHKEMQRRMGCSKNGLGSG